MTLSASTDMWTGGSTANQASTGSNDVLLRGSDAERAQPIDLSASPTVIGGGAFGTSTEIKPTGPWAEDQNGPYETAKRAGFADGLRQGMDQAVEDCRAATQITLEPLIDALETGIAAFDEAMKARSRELSAEATTLALEIAAVVLGREVAAATDPGAEAIVRCLDVAPDIGDVCVHLHPEDAELLGDQADLAGRTLTIVPDGSLERGDAVVRVNDATIDGRLSSALERVAEVLQ